MDKTKGKLRFLLQRPIFSCGFIEYKGPCHLRTFKSTDYLYIAMYDLENRYCVKQKLVTKNENEKKKEKKFRKTN